MRRKAWGAAMFAALGIAVACGGGGESSQFTEAPDGGELLEAPPPPAPFGTSDAAPDARIGDGGLDCDAEPGACIPPGVCGDGKPGLGESCDDGNTNPGDGCSATCTIEAPYWACAFGVACVDVRDCAALADAGLAGDGDGGCVAPPKPAVCGDRVIDPGEACDDGNVTGGDGCSFDCTSIEANWACPTPGAPCITTVVCGDGRITGSEQCDDGNVTAGDGCSAGCQLESGWACAVPGASCSAKQCGDGLVAGAEECDDGNTTNDDGCSSTCRLQSRTTTVAPTTTTSGSTTVTHFDCKYPVPPNVPLRQVCATTVCGNGVREGTEQCDDGNKAPLDGCSPSCELEPMCPDGACVARCGDGLLFDFDANGDGQPDEQCDDGNTRGGDGCSATCTVETGYQCVTQIADSPTFIDVPVVLRDFHYSAMVDPFNHPDFEAYSCPNVTPGLVQSALLNRVPVFRWNGVGVDPVTNTDTNGTCGRQLTSDTDFTDWYRDIDITVQGQPRRRSKRFDNVQIRLSRQGAAGNYSYVFDSATDDPYDTRGGFFPLDGLGWGNTKNGHNFAFTTELRYWFTYDAASAPQLDFSGDDDVWVFINGKLALDIGGLHSIRTGSFVLNAAKAAELGLKDKHVYEVALFHAERHTDDSNFKLTLRGFVKKRSQCTNICGDGIKTREEQCDLGAANQSPAAVPYGGCTTACKLGPYCGDKAVTNPPEQCDDGVNLTPWTPAFSATACGPSCKAPTYCGDSIVQSGNGERCDNGANNTDSPNAYNACRTTCQPGPRCGDGTTQAQFGEQCDNGFNVTSYVKAPTATDCAPGCKKPRFCGDGVVDFPFEQCDQGANNTNNGAYGTCSTSCTLGPRCGDGIVQAPEQCDDGNRLNEDGCSAACLTEVPK